MITPVFINPNPDKGLKETRNLNNLSKTFRGHSFYRNVEKEGFELNYVSWDWEWEIRFKNKSGFMVFREDGGDLVLYVYSFDDDLDPRIFVIRGYKENQQSKVIDLVKFQWATLRFEVPFK